MKIRTGDTVKVIAGKDKGKTYDIVQRNMQSLKDYKLKLYKPYSKNEIDLLKPSTNWTVDCFGKSEKLKL